MTEQSPFRRRRSRRAFIKSAAALGVAAAGAATFPGSNVRVDAIRRSDRRRRKARNEEVRDRSASDFAAGHERGASIRGQGSDASIRGRSGASFESRGISAPFAPSHVGLCWTGRGARPSDVSVSVRGSRNGQNWSDWQELGIEAISSNAHGAIPVHGELQDDSLLDADGIKVFGTLAGLNRPRFLQYRIDFRSDQDVEIDEVTLACIDARSDEDEGSSSFFATARADEITDVTLTNDAGVSINVTTREGWGVDEDHDNFWEERFVPVKKVFLHHTATSNNYSDGAAEVRAIHSYHAINLGWGDIGYQILVDRFGNIYEGRRGRDPEEGGREILSNGVEGGHVLSYNYGSTAIAAIGNSQQGQWNRTWSNEAYDALVDAVAFECGRHFLHPEGQSDFLRTDRVWHEGLTHCVGHRDAEGDGGSTQCPGSRLYDFLNNELRNQVADKLEGAGAPSGLSGTQAGNQLEFDWDGGSDDDFEVFFEGWWRWVEDGVSQMDYLSDHSNAFKEHEWASTRDDGESWQGDPQSGSSADVELTETGQYTLHVRKAVNGFSFADHLTVHVEDLDDSDEPDDPEEPEEYRVSGVVAVEGTDLDDTIEGATVTLIGHETDVNEEIVTDEDGEFDFGEVPAGDYEVTATADGYEPQTIPITVDDNDIEVIFALEPEEEENGEDEPDDLTIDEFNVSSRTTGPWFRANVSWAVSGNNLESVTSRLLDGSGNQLDSATGSISGSSASGKHELRTRESGASIVELIVTDSNGNSVSDQQSI